MLLLRSARRVSASSRGLSSTSRITLLFISPLSGRGQCEVEGRARADLALGPDAPAVAADDALDGRQAHARPPELARAVETLERAEQLCGLGHRETRAVVAGEVEALAAAAPPVPGGDHGLLALRGELPGVAEQVVEHDPQQPLVAIRRGVLRS